MATIPIRDGVLITSATLFIPACSIVVGLRFYTRRIQKVPLGIDDWLTIPALILVIGMQVTMIVEYRLKHIGYRIPNAIPGVPDSRANRVLWPFELEEIPALGLTKLTFILFFRRIFNTRIKRWYNWLTSGMIVVTIAWMIGFFFAFLFMCGSQPKWYWISAKEELAKCVRTQHLHNGLAISDVILDIIIMSMSIPIVWRLNMSTIRKLGVASMFLFGVLTVGASILRAAVFLQDVAERYNPNLDYELLVTSGVYWSMLEVGLGLIAANLVVFYGLLVSRARKTRPKMSLGMFKLPSATIQSDTENDTRRSDERKMWNGPSATVASSAEYAGAGSLQDESYVELQDIHITQTLDRTEVGL